MKIHIHNIYITYKIVSKSGADSSSRSREITIFAQRTVSIGVQNLPLQKISNR